MSGIYNGIIIELQKKLRVRTIKIFYNFDLSMTSEVLKNKEEIISYNQQLINESENSKELLFFKNNNILYNSIFHLVEWADSLLKGKLDSDAKIIASKSNILIFDINLLNHIPDFKEKVSVIIEGIKSIDNTCLKDLEDIIKKFVFLDFPTLSYLKLVENKFNFTKDIEDEEKTVLETYILSLDLYLQGSPWANPQILKDKELYLINGIVKINNKPNDYNFLKIIPSTTNSKILDFNIDEIELTDNLEYEIKGSILFTYPQNSFEETLSIKLIPYFSNINEEEIKPVIIGYDELIIKVINKDNPLFQTGFELMNKKVFEIYTNPILNQLLEKEKNNFIIFLNGIINFQGFCLQRAKYKGISSLKEDVFRDDLIQHLTSNPNIGENISKEPHIAGGRVELVFNGIIAELKVETKISDREKLMKKYSSQPVAYSSGNSKLVSIVCVLDLIEKTLPPSSGINNIILKTVKTHGFVDSEPEYQHTQVFVFFDGNNKNPSDYSK